MRSRFFVCLAFCLGIAVAASGWFAQVGLAETAGAEPITQSAKCNWELTIKDSQAYLFTEGGETVKKIATVEITATKKGGTDYFGKYTGKGVITLSNALAPEDDAAPVLFGGRSAATKEFKLSFTIEPIETASVPTLAFAPVAERDNDGVATLMFALKENKIRGIFQQVMKDEAFATGPLSEYQDEDKVALMFVDGGYVELTLENDWQIPGAFIGTVIGVPVGKVSPGATPDPTRVGQQGAVELEPTYVPTGREQYPRNP